MVSSLRKTFHFRTSLSATPKAQCRTLSSRHRHLLRRRRRRHCIRRNRSRNRSRRRLKSSLTTRRQRKTSVATTPRRRRRRQPCWTRGWCRRTWWPSRPAALRWSSTRCQRFKTFISSSLTLQQSKIHCLSPAGLVYYLWLYHLEAGIQMGCLPHRY